MLVVLATRPKRSLATSHIRVCEYRLGGNRRSSSLPAAIAALSLPMTVALHATGFEPEWRSTR